MINKVILMGRLTKDPELRYANNKSPVCSFRLAVDTGHGEHKTTDFISCVAWNKTAEFVSKYFRQGMLMIAVGRIGSRTWEGNDGKKNYAMEVVVKEVSFGEKKRETAEGNIPADGFAEIDDTDLPWRE